MIKIKSIKLIKKIKSIKAHETSKSLIFFKVVYEWRVRGHSFLTQKSKPLKTKKSTKK